MRKPKYDDKVVKLLSKGPLKSAFISKQLGMRQGTLYKVLDRLITKGVVVKNGSEFSVTGIPAAVDQTEAFDPKPISKAIARPPIKSFLEKEIESVTDELNESLSKVYVLKAVKARLMMALENARQGRS